MKTATYFLGPAEVMDVVALHHYRQPPLLDPSEVMGADYPSETFRVLKDKEIRQYGEYRTRRLVLAAWDRLETGELR